jgi:hypothetical protein
MKYQYNEYQKEYPLDTEKEILFSKEIRQLFDALDLVLT